MENISANCCNDNKESRHTHDHSSDHDHTHISEEQTWWKSYLPAMISFILLTTGMITDHFTDLNNAEHFFKGFVRMFYYLIAYLIIGGEVIWMAVKNISKGYVFNEFFLMTIATIGAFYIGEYPEGVAVMLFYQIGELFQNNAVLKAKRSIKALLDVRPDEVSVIRHDNVEKVNPAQVAIGEIIRIKPGEKVALDGELLSEKGSFNTAALTGESKPDNKYRQEMVLAGMINLHTVSEIKVTSLFKDSKLSKILEMVQEATTHKAKTQLFISRFAKIYTPIVVLLAILITLIPYFIVDQYVFNDWLYRALVFLVISCPCALVVSIPLGYFGGIGLASRNGILFKGSNYLDMMTEIDTVVMDKTGTLTHGTFKVQQIVPHEITQDSFLKYTAALEVHSTHPIAKAIVEHSKELMIPKSEQVSEIAGHGLKGIIEGKEVLVGNVKLLKKFNITMDDTLLDIPETIVVTAIDGKYAGYLTIADEIKEDAAEAIRSLHSINIHTIMLSGDKESIVNKVAHKLKINEAYGNLLPEEKVVKVQALKNNNRKIAFVGDGLNDAPVIAMADVGIAMGGLGSDATIETADIVIQNDQPSKIFAAIKAGKITKRIVWQNITLSFGVKLIVLLLGASGVASLWEAVFADVGVALLAILNAIRIQRIKI